MQVREHATTSTTPALIANVLGFLAALVVLAVLTNTSLLVPGGDAAALAALVLIGAGMCAIGGLSRAPATLGWMHPVTLSGAVLGVAILVLIVANAFGGTGVLAPFASAIGISVERAVVLILALLLAVKWAIGLAFVR
jgi:hypothetical protein